MPQAAKASPLENFLSWAGHESEALRAVDQRILALQNEIESRDMVLSSQLLLTAEDFNNNREALTFARRLKSRTANVTLLQPLPTGTLFSLMAGQERALIEGRGLRYFADWEARITQSLWRDGFGRATSLRHEGEEQEHISRKAALLYEKNLLLIDLESIYWDLARYTEEEVIRKKSLESSRELLKWMRSRMKNLAAEKVDLLQVEALVSGRELDLISVQNQIATLRVRLLSFLPNLPTDNWAPDAALLDQTRSLNSLVSGVSSAPGTPPQRWDTLSTVALVQQAETEAKKIREGLKPQFDVYVGYGQNGITNTYDSSWEHAGLNRYSGTRVGVTFSMPLNRKLVNKQVLAAQMGAEATRLQAESQKRSSLLTWKDLERQQLLVQAQSTEASRLAQFQIQKAIEERRRLKIGRSTLFQLVSFEVEAAESAARRLTFLAELRKVESQARLFTNERGVN